ncbi:MAG: hypothetical protein JY451_03220 [Erythrobacter sp.]|nr:MAG: hypothetical protein JY451_03220 [Erythrobacter sp.]
MKRIALLLGGATLALSSTLALATGPENLLPPAFRDPPPRATPTPSPAPTPTPRATQNTPTAPSGGSVSTPVVQDIPAAGTSSATTTGGTNLPSNFPSLRELEAMEEDEINEALGLRPRFDIPAAARRSMEGVGVLSIAEGGFPVHSLARQPAALVRAALSASDGPLVSRWGHILLRRALASRLDAPAGMNPAEFAALRARALGGMGEAAVARALVQDVDPGNYNRALTDAAFDSYLATGDVLGMCPVARLQRDLREDGEWEMVLAMCAAFDGEARSAERTLDRALGTGLAPEIDVRLAQRYAGAAGDGGRAVNIEWDGVDELTPWRFALARALGVDLPESLREEAASRYDLAEVNIPAAPLLDRVNAADRAGARGVLSSAAMVDLYSQLWASDAYDAEAKASAVVLRNAYTAREVADRVAAMRQLWGEDDGAGFGRSVLTAHAAARVPASENWLDDAPALIASMLAAGLDRNAMLWGSVVPEGSEGWALLALAQPNRTTAVSSGAVNEFLGEDASPGSRKSAFLVAGLAGLGRLEDGAFANFADDLDVNYTRSSPWSEAISRAAQVDNATLVALLAGLGMQGTSWDQMTARQLYFIVASLNRVGLSAEARMIAAEAVARG